MRRWRACATLASLALLTLVGCSSDGSDAPTALGDGYEVAEGSTLIGTTLPGEHEGEWTAWLHVDGDPREVVERYLDQAERQGLTVEPLPPASGSARTQLARCGEIGEGRYACAAAATGGGSCLAMELHRDRRSSYLELRRLVEADAESCTFVGVAADASVDPPPPPEASDRPEVDELFGDDWGMLAAVRVQADSTVVAGPMGDLAILSVDGDSEEVLDRYAEDFRAALQSDATPEAEATNWDGRTVLRRRLIDPERGLALRADLVVDRDGDAWLFVSAVPAEQHADE
jgi:hypothetical protein